MCRWQILLLGFAVGLCGYPSPSPARPVESWPYDKLMKKSDLAVFAEALKTEPASDTPPEHHWPRKFVAQNTTFQVKYVLKGKAQKGQIKVLHFRFGGQKEDIAPQDVLGDIIINGPNFVAFRTKAVGTTGRCWKPVRPAPEYLLFLRRLKDGRYEPVSGQIDPVLSVREVAIPLGNK
jgi:hypothetical protein